MPFSFKKLGKVIAVRFWKNRQNGSVVTCPDSGDQAVPVAIPGVLSSSALLSDSSAGHVVSSRIEQRAHISTPGAYDVAQLVLSGVNGVVAPIPLVGGSLQAAINGLSTLLQTINRHTQNKAAIASLRRRLNRLSVHLCNAPIARDGLEQLRREDLISVLQETSDQLKKLDKRFLGYQSVPQTIAGCSSDIDQYLAEYAFSAQMQVQNYVVEMRETLVRHFGESAATDLPGIITLGCLILADATGHEHNIPLEFCTSFQQLSNMLKVLFTPNTDKACIQRRYLEEGQYDLCIDRGTRVIQLTGETDEWSMIEAGTKVVMRVIIDKDLDSASAAIKCDACGCSKYSVQPAGTKGSHCWMICCQGCKRRYQVTIPSRKRNGGGISIFPREIDRKEMDVIRNMHVRERVELKRKVKRKEFEVRLRRFRKREREEVEKVEVEVRREVQKGSLEVRVGVLRRLRFQSLSFQAGPPLWA